MEQINIPVENGVFTIRDIDLFSDQNENILEDFQTIDTLPIITINDTSCFDLANLPKIDNLNDLLRYFCELMIRFDSEPKHYQKGDYEHLIKTIINSLIYLYTSQITTPSGEVLRIVVNNTSSTNGETVNPVNLETRQISAFTDHLKFIDSPYSISHINGHVVLKLSDSIINQINDSVKYITQLKSNTEKQIARNNIDAVSVSDFNDLKTIVNSSTSGDINNVKVISQTFTPEQKVKARTNIDAAGSEEFNTFKNSVYVKSEIDSKDSVNIKFITQNLTVPQQIQARQNIDAVGNVEFNNYKNTVYTKEETNTTNRTFVSVLPQNFTHNEQDQARNNIAAVSTQQLSTVASERYTKIESNAIDINNVKVISQTFTPEQKVKARQNIDAVGNVEFNNLKDTVNSINGYSTQYIDNNFVGYSSQNQSSLKKSTARKNIDVNKTFFTVPTLEITNGDRLILNDKEYIRIDNAWVSLIPLINRYSDNAILDFSKILDIEAEILDLQNISSSNQTILTFNIN